MDIVTNVIVLLHFMGWAALFGGLIVQSRSPEKVVNAAMRDGVGLAVVAGVVLVGLAEMGDGAVDHAKVGVKAAVGLILLVVTMANARKATISEGVFRALVLLTLFNMAVAIFWE